MTSPPALAVVAGPHSGATLSLAGGAVTIGRSSRCGLVLPDADTSRRHAVAEARWGSVLVHDLGSTNGTTVDDLPVGVVPVAVPDGARLCIGESVLTPDHPGRTGEDPVALLRAAEAGARRCDDRDARHLRVRLGHRSGVGVHHDVAAGSLALAGPYASGLAWWVLAQLAATQPPARLRVVLMSARLGHRWGWASRLPHSIGRVVEGPAECAAAAAELAVALAAASCRTPDTAPRTLLVADLRGAGGVPAELAALVHGGGAGLAVLALGCADDGVEDLCRAAARPRGDTGTRMSLTGGPEFVVDAVGERWAGRLASALAGQPPGGRAAGPRG